MRGAVYDLPAANEHLSQAEGQWAGESSPEVFFEPFRQARLVIMKSIIPDWNDARSSEYRARCCAAAVQDDARPGGGTLARD